MSRPAADPFPRGTAAPIPPLRAWSARTEGSITIFALFIFVAMILVAGIAVDAMRIEHERVRIQGASDRAALAATMLRENISGATPEQIVMAYMQAEGLADMVETPIPVIEGNGSRQVTISTQARMPSMFMRLLGVDEAIVQTRSVAIEELAAPRIEVVMVLDVTGSMGARTANGLTRIENLRNAATDLVRQLLEGREPGEVALTIVPYAEHVLPPPGFINHFVNLPAGTGACPDFLDYGGFLDSFLAPVLRRTCATQSWRTVRPYVHDVNQAVAIIRGLQASGTTSIDLGIRFGAMFFDPSIRPAIEQMISNGAVHEAFAGYPLSHSDRRAVRAMILMTDGANCCGGRFPVAVQDAQALQICDALRQAQISVYAVAFEAPRAGIALMEACATNPNYFFNTNGAGIADAFAAVGRHLQSRALQLIE